MSETNTTAPLPLPPPDSAAAIAALRKQAAARVDATTEDWADDPLPEPSSAAPENDDPPVEGEEEHSEEAAAEPYFPNCYQWFQDWLVPTWTRPLTASTATWCPQWWCHPEAVSRVEALWRAWEQLRLDPGTGMSVWWRDHADHHLPTLLATDGPFKGCGPEKRHTTRPVPLLPVEPVPDGLLAPGDGDYRHFAGTGV